MMNWFLMKTHNTQKLYAYSFMRTLFVLRTMLKV